MFLANKHIRKAVVGVTKDLRMLAQECKTTVQCEGALELSLMAKELLVTSNANLGLSNLCAAVLKQNLPKNVAEHVSMQWT
jgi:hypothetical protein